MSKILVGTNRNDYNTERHIIGHSYSDFEVRRLPDACNLTLAVLSRLGRKNKYYRHAHYPIPGIRPALWHLWRAVSHGNTPWITSFSTITPSCWASRTRKGVELMAGDACKRLIATSRRAFDAEVRFLRGRFPDLAEEIIPKLMVLYPPQDPLVASYDKPETQDNDVRFIFVGGDFFRKGGGEILRVFERLLSRGAPVHITIVSTLNTGDYASDAGDNEREWALRIIAAWPDRIRHYKRLPNVDVIEIMRQSHVLLLPTYADAFGYTVLEGQAAACACITTDVCALPEVVPKEVGWCIDVPKRANGKAKYKTLEERAILSDSIEKGLSQTINEILNRPSLIEEKANAAIRNIRDNHSTAKHAESTSAIYHDVLSWGE